jgi:hypothetical protein
MRRRLSRNWRQSRSRLPSGTLTTGKLPLTWNRLSQIPPGRRDLLDYRLAAFFCARSRDSKFFFARLMRA